MTRSKQIEIPILVPMDLAFGTTRYLPQMEDCKAPKDFQDIAATLFHKGSLGCPDKLKPKAGVNWKEALKFVHAHLKSFDPSHEHKMAGCGQLLSNYFDLKEPA